jgi:hypothetical protein
MPTERSARRLVSLVPPPTFDALHYCRGIGDVVKVAMREHQADPFTRERAESAPAAHRREYRGRRLVVKTVGAEHTAGEGFDRFMRKWSEK